jgi:hypothetical protein
MVWWSTTKSLILRLWYLALGALVAVLATECVRLRAERDELVQVVNKSLEIVDRTNATSTSCLTTLSDVRRQLYPALWETSNSIKNSPVLPVSKPATAVAASGQR